jgi:hypothetical protein
LLLISCCLLGFVGLLLIRFIRLIKHMRLISIISLAAY